MVGVVAMSFASYEGIESYPYPSFSPNHFSVTLLGAGP